MPKDLGSHEARWTWTCPSSQHSPPSEVSGVGWGKEILVVNIVSSLFISTGEGDHSCDASINVVYCELILQTLIEHRGMLWVWVIFLGMVVVAMVDSWRHMCLPVAHGAWSEAYMQVLAGLREAAMLKGAVVPER